MPAERPGVLAGFTVLDFTHALSGPTLTRYLAEMGASVVKVEAPPAGDLTRRSATVKDGRSGYFLTVNRGKHSLCIDVKDPRGRDAVLDLVERVDVVVENFRAGTLDRLGLGWEVLHAENPRLVLCSVTGFGSEGPLAHLAGYDGVAQAYSGVTSLNSASDGTPTLNGAAVGDVLTGVNGVAAVLGALLWRERTGEGQHVEVSLVGSYMQTHDSSIQSYSLSDGTVAQRGSGRLHPFASPYGIFPTVDGGHLFICAAADHHWRDLCDAMGRPELAAPDHPWAVRHRREADKDRVNSLVEEWTMAQPSRDDALAHLQAHRVPVGPVLGVDEVVADDDLRRSGLVATATDPVVGTFTVPGFPLRFGAADHDHKGAADAEAPFLGEHNREVLTGLGSMSDCEYEALVADGIVVAEPVRNRPSRRGPAAF